MKYYGWLQYGGAGLVPPEPVWDLSIELQGLHALDLKAGKPVAKWNPDTFAYYNVEAIHVDFPFTSDLIPIHSSRLAVLISKECPNVIQYLPIHIKSRPLKQTIDDYFIANHLRVVDCLDRDRAEYEIWSRNNLLYWEKRPWLLGTFRTIRKFVLQTTKIVDDKLFRLWGWDMVIVREDLKISMEQSGITGGRYHEIETV